MISFNAVAASLLQKCLKRAVQRLNLKVGIIQNLEFINLRSVRSRMDPIRGQLYQVIVKFAYDFITAVNF